VANEGGRENWREPRRAKRAGMDGSDVGPQPRPSRKRLRANGGGDLDGVLERLEEALRNSPQPPGQLLVAAQRLQQLQACVERKLACCRVDCLTPHEAIAFIYSKRVRLIKIARNDFEDASDDDGATGAAAAASAAGAASAAAGAGAASAGAGSTGGGAQVPTIRSRSLVAHFQVGRARISAACRADSLVDSAAPSGGSLPSRYVAKLRALPQPAAGTAANGEGAPTERGQVLLKLHSWDQALSVIEWPAWEALRGRSGNFDRRPAADFAWDIALLGVFRELRRKFAKETSDSEDEAPGIFSTLSTCEMMASAVLPSATTRPPEPAPATPPQEAEAESEAAVLVD